AQGCGSHGQRADRPRELGAATPNTAFPDCRQWARPANLDRTSLRGRTRIRLRQALDGPRYPRREATTNTDRSEQGRFAANNPAPRVDSEETNASWSAPLGLFTAAETDRCANGIVRRSPKNASSRTRVGNSRVFMVSDASLGGADEDAPGERPCEGPCGRAQASAQPPPEDDQTARAPDLPNRSFTSRQATDQACAARGPAVGQPGTEAVRRASLIEIRAPWW